MVGNIMSDEFPNCQKMFLAFTAFNILNFGCMVGNIMSNEFPNRQKTFLQVYSHSLYSHEVVKNVIND